MEWEPNERDAWVSDAQRWICQIKGVLQCKIDLDPDGEVTGVHVVAGTERQPRHIVRDVEGLLKARLGLDVFYKKIGVVQVLNNGSEDFAAKPDANEADGKQAIDAATLAAGAVAAAAEAATAADAAAPDPEPTAPEPPAQPATAPVDEPVEPPAPVPAILVAEEVNPRIICSGVGVMASEMVVRAEVQLRSGDVEARGVCEGPNHAGSDAVLVAKAALEAISQLLVDPILLHLSEVRTTSLGGQEVIETAVDLVEGRRSETLFGACSASHNRQQAVVYSILDALNRRLSLFALKSTEAHG